MDLRYPLDMRLGWLHSWSRNSGEERETDSCSFQKLNHNCAPITSNDRVSSLLFHDCPSYSSSE